MVVCNDDYSENQTFSLSFLLKHVTSRRVGLLKVAKWQAEIENEAGRIYHDIPCTDVQKATKLLYAKLEWYEQVKEATTLLELALWKAKLDQQTSIPDRENVQKRARVEVLSSRSNCRVDSGASVVIPRVLEYLLPHVST